MSKKTGDVRPDVLAPGAFEGLDLEGFLQGQPLELTAGESALLEAFFGFFDDSTESPIEKDMAFALLMEAMKAGYTGAMAIHGDRNLPFGTPDGPVLYVELQARAGRYRVDMAVSELLTPDADPGRPHTVAIVECDGHDYHERTKEQARRDRARDRWFSQYPIFMVMRFTGSEIHADSHKCAREVIKALQARRPKGGRHGR